MNHDLGEFISTIYPCRFQAQKVQSVEVPRALAKLGDKRHSGDSPSELLSSIRTFLFELSNVMLGKRDRGILKQPTVHLSSGNASSENCTANWPLKPVSLALIRLKSASKHARNTSYETQVRVEAAAAATFVHLLRDCCPDDDVFVATPHRIQREAVKAALQKARITEPFEKMFQQMNITEEARGRGVTVETIERLQGRDFVIQSRKILIKWLVVGSEASFVICLLSATRPHTGDLAFLLERRRLNVAISRAKSLCIVISSDAVLDPPAESLADEGTLKGYSFLKAFEQSAWSYDLIVQAEAVL